MHTSTVTVAVMSAGAGKTSALFDRDILIFTTKDSGPGGQHRNKTESCVIMRHLPTGIEAKAASKSQHRNKETARAVLEARVGDHLDAIARSSANERRQQQVGSGMRGDKIRTYRAQDDRVVDHRSDRKVSLSALMKGSLTTLADLSASG